MENFFNENIKEIPLIFNLFSGIIKEK